MNQYVQRTCKACRVIVLNRLFCGVLVAVVFAKLPNTEKKQCIYNAHRQSQAGQLSRLQLLYLFTVANLLDHEFSISMTHETV